ncbi:KilA-N domain-containing protein [Nostoc sp. CMAA1605]|uniref:KilA-N domain-containing protein n=1 Tax=Nostoc sp. CMAA1605 TaxID=2055159 RepID=UPI001F319681|nr:KilA-N domain-containing protein [Nostoc sp. CMAA1605]MCF4970826.1 DNA-binding protein [Nostoc sp. CMAA1605]
MSKTEKILVEGFPIAVKDDYISLTDMARRKDGETKTATVIANWLRSKSTIDFLGIWEAINNPLIFNVLEFEDIKQRAGVQDFSLSVSEWVEKTGAIGIYSVTGKNGGTFAHRDIAFEFGTTVSPAFKLYLIKEFQRLKEIENNSGNIEWNVRRLLSKANYVIQTDAIKNYKIPALNVPDDKKHLAYAEEGDILNLALYGFTAKEWREANVEISAKGMTVRDFSSINELMVLTTLEGINAEMIKANVSFEERLKRLRQIASEQLETLNKINGEFGMRKNKDGEFVAPHMANFPKSKIGKPDKGYLS